MKFKTINDFTLKECIDYLNTNPNGELAYEVSERMLELVSTNEIKKVAPHDLRNDFIKKFKRLYATKRYAEAFLLCLNSINNPLLASLACSNGELVIPRMLNKGVIHTPNNVNIDFIIDILINNGYEKLNFRKNGLYLFPDVSICIKNNVITVKQPIFLIFLVVVIYPFSLLLPITLPLLIYSLKKRRKIIRLICSSFLQSNQ